MADKEERILIDVINPGINCVYRLDNDTKGISLCKHNGNMEPVTAKECKHCDEGMTRQEAIEVMAKAMFVILPRFSNLEYEILACEILAKEALNALLEGASE